MRKIITSLDQIGVDLEKLRTEFPDLASGAMTMVIDERIMNESREECPVRTGELRRSATVNSIDRAQIEQGRIRIPFGYGTNYAYIVHENITGFWIRPKAKKALAFLVGKEKVVVKAVWMPPNPKAKFLENPANRHVDDLPAEVLTRIEQLMGVA